MATDGIPAIARPITARMTTSVVKLGEKATATVRAAESSSDRVMMPLRPNASDSDPATSSITASTPVVADTARLEAAAPTWKSAAKAGINGCSA